MDTLWRDSQSSRCPNPFSIDIFPTAENGTILPLLSNAHAVFDWLPVPKPKGWHSTVFSHLSFRLLYINSKYPLFLTHTPISSLGYMEMAETLSSPPYRQERGCAVFPVYLWRNRHLRISGGWSPEGKHLELRQSIGQCLVLWHFKSAVQFTQRFPRIFLHTPLHEWGSAIPLFACLHHVASDRTHLSIYQDQCMISTEKIKPSLLSELQELTKRKIYVTGVSLTLFILSPEIKR